MRLLVRLPRWLGDTVMAEPTLHALHEELGPNLTVAGEDSLLELLRPGLPSARLLPCGRRPDPRTWRGHDAVLLLDGSLASAWAAVRAGIPCRVGFSCSGRGLLLTDGLHPPAERGRTPLGLGRKGRWPRRLPRPFGASCTDLAGRVGVSVIARRPRLLPSEAARATVRSQLGGGEPYLALQAGGRPGSAKGLEPEHWRAILEALRGAGFEAPVFVLAGPGEEQAALRAAQVPGARAVVDPVASLPQLVAWLEGASLVVATDGGPRHVAQAVGTPRVVLFGPTDPRYTAAAGSDELQLRDEVPCGPCHLERCPLPARVCQQGFTPERVAEAVLAAWPIR